MRNLSRLLMAAALVALAIPAMASASPSGTRGVVVQRDTHAGSIVLASSSGALTTVPSTSPSRFSMGDVVQMSGSKLRVLGHRHRARVRGVVLRRGHGSYSLAGNGSVLSVSSTTPPAVGQQVTADVQMDGRKLYCNHSNVHVEDTQAPSAEVRGTVISQDATTLKLNVFGFTSGLTIALGGQTIPALAVGTQVEAEVSLGPDPANPSGIVLTLVALHVDDNNAPGQDHGSFVKAEGAVKAVTEAGPTGGAVGSITVTDPEQGDVTFVIPAGFGATGVAVGDQVEAKGTAATTAGGQPTLLRLEANGDGGDDNGDGGSGAGDGHHHGWGHHHGGWGDNQGGSSWGSGDGGSGGSPGYGDGSGGDN
jgi:hypothetical protein